MEQFFTLRPSNSSSSTEQRALPISDEHVDGCSVEQPAVHLSFISNVRRCLDINKCEDMSNFLIQLSQQPHPTVLQLPLSVLQIACNCLGPSFSSFRTVCVAARLASNHLDVAEEILKWHCVNGTFLYLCPMLHHKGWLEHLGMLPLLCPFCDQVSRRKHIYRLDPGLQDPSSR